LRLPKFTEPPSLITATCIASNEDSMVRDYRRPVSRHGNNGALMVTYEQTLVSDIPEENSRAFVSEMSATDIVMAVAS
jgi:hypothetical protein